MRLIIKTKQRGVKARSKILTDSLNNQMENKTNTNEKEIKSLSDKMREKRMEKFDKKYGKEIEEDIRNQEILDEADKEFAGDKLI